MVLGRPWKENGEGLRGAKKGLSWERGGDLWLCAVGMKVKKTKISSGSRTGGERDKKETDRGEAQLSIFQGQQESHEFESPGLT